MEHHAIGEVEARRAEAGSDYLEFLRVPDLSVGLYVLPGGGSDTQTAHRQDEIYYVLRGSGKIQVDGIDQEIAPGSVVYVEKEADHCFHSFDEDLELLVVFAPAYTGR